MYYPAVTKASDVPILRAKYPEATTIEWCACCEREALIRAYSEGVCPHCGERLIPCSMCEECTPECPYE